MAILNNKKTKFHFNEKVKILDGFYKTHEGTIRSVKTHFLNEPKYVVKINYGEKQDTTQHQNQTSVTLNGGLNVYSGISQSLGYPPGYFYTSSNSALTLEVEVYESDLCHANFNKKLNEIVNGD